MITIKMYENEWQIQIGDEIWQFENLKELRKNLDVILELKEKHGRLHYGN